MARALDRLFTIEEWASFEGEPDTRYELFDGRLVAMAPPRVWHGSITSQIVRICGDALRDRFPCRAQVESGVEVRREPRAKVYVPDVAVTCEPIDENRSTMAAPRLVIEVASPGSDGYDKTVKVPDYKGLPTVEEIWLVWSASRAVLVWKRGVDGGWPERPDAAIAKGSFDSAVLGVTVELDEIYRFVPMRAPEPIELPDDPEPS